MSLRRLAFVISIVAGAAACNAPTATPAFKAAADKQADAVVRAFLDAAKAGDAKAVADRVCDGGIDRARSAIEGPLKIDSYDVTRVEPAWVGAEPYFRVDVALKKGDAVDKRSSSVRAREGCVDRLLGEPVEAAKPADGEIEL